MKCLSTLAAHLNDDMDTGARAMQGAIAVDGMSRYFVPLATTPYAAPNRRSRTMQEQRSSVQNKDWDQL